MAETLQNFIDGKWLDAQDGERFDVFNPATGEVIATAPDSKAADAELAVSAARRTFDEGAWWPGTTPRGVEGSSCAPPRSSAGARAARADGGARRRQADRRRARGHRRGRLHVRVLRRVGDEDRRRRAAPVGRRDVHGVEGADRRRRRHHAVELPDDDGDAEARARARGRVHLRPQAAGADPLTCSSCRRSSRRPGFRTASSTWSPGSARRRARRSSPTRGSTRSRSPARARWAG